MPARQQADQYAIDYILLADDDLPDFFANFFQLPSGELERFFRLHALILHEIPGGLRAQLLWPRMNANELDSLVRATVGAAYEVANVLGCGFLEKVYEKALVRELGLRGLKCNSQVAFPITYKDHPAGDYVADLIVGGLLLVELKCVDSLAGQHIAKCINYLRASGLPLALLINFQRPKMEWKRIVYSRPFAAKSFGG